MKSARHAKIIQLISENEIETQEDLAKFLNQEGYQVTQATVSRDIKELKLTKVSRGNKKSVYTVFQDSLPNWSQKYERVLKEAFVSMDVAGNLLVMKTAPGMAMAVGAALDGLQWKEILGCIAGDDTIMCAIRTQQDAVNVMGKIRKITQH